MYKGLRIGIKYLHYLVTAKNGRGHGIHSPFVYDLIRNVFMDKKQYPEYVMPEVYRKSLLADHRLLEVEDLGAGSRSGKVRTRRVSEIARTSAKPERYSQLLYRLAVYFNHTRILEMGTSLGVTSSYLAQVPGLEQLVTMEGAGAVADIAEKHFNLCRLGRVRVLRGDFASHLGAAIADLEPMDMVFIDGNHRFEPTLEYFEALLPYTHEESCIVFDDIHWSAGMEAAWDRIRQDERVTLSIDLFFIGLIFFRKDFREKQHFVIRF